MNAETGRGLSHDEIAIVSALLDMAHPEGALLWQQVAELRVLGACGCGCPTVDFGNGRNALELIADAKVSGTDGDAVLLFGHDGVLDRLEYMWVGGPPPAAWPPPEALQNVRRPADVVVDIAD